MYSRLRSLFRRDPDEGNSAFCVLPWLHLYSGPDGWAGLCCISSEPLVDETGRGYNVQTHPFAEIFNSPAHQDVRRKMLVGERVPHCTTCYNEEQHGRSHRQIYNDLWLRGEHRALGLTARIARSGAAAVIEKPVSIDIRFGNLCNLRCQICNSQNSSQVELDPVVSAWNKSSYWRPEHRFGTDEEWHQAPALLEEVIGFTEDVREIKLGGGEPTINPTVIAWLESLIATGRSHHIRLSVSTNFTNTSPRFFDLMPLFKAVHLYLSIDGFGPLNDYLRYPSRWKVIERNTAYVKRMQSRNAAITATVTPVINAYNALSITHLFEWAETQGFAIIANEVRGVPQIDCMVIPPDGRRLAVERMKAFMASSEAHRDNVSIKSLCSKLSADGSGSVEQFRTFTRAADENRGMHFETYAPEMARLLGYSASPTAVTDAR
jgi:pyruvate-formate lyase-activating enzyme